MRILTIGNFGNGWDGSICDERHIADALMEQGHEVYMIQREDHSVLPDFLVDFVLIAQWGGYPDEFIERVKSKYEVPLVYWAFDYHFAGAEDWHCKLVQYADLFITKELANIHTYQKIAPATKIRWLSQDFAPQFLKPHPDYVEQDIDVLFTGSYLPWDSAVERNRTIKAIDEKYNLVVHSVTPGEWSNYGIKNSLGPVMDHGLPELYARAKVVISIDHVNSMGYWSDRNAQIMACGAVPLFRHVPFSESVFHNGIVYFYDINDCLAKIQRLLNTPEEDRKMMGNYAYGMAERFFKVNRRVEDLLTLVREVL